jgi:hypothetical protein
MTRFILYCLLIFILCEPTFAQTKKVNQKDLRNLASIMAGDFNSAVQSKTDTSFLNISLRMEPIWTERTGGYWLYVEQALTSMQDRPYRQRIYHLYLHDEVTLVSKVFELPDPKKYIGAWKEISKFENLSIDDLIDRQGCSIFLHKQGRKKFSGSTPGKECLSALRGASYATSEVIITPTQLISWDRGWNSDDIQVWGSTNGGYIFDKLKNN